MQEDTKPPIAVIGFSDQASPLEPLWPSTHRSLMSIAGKSLIIYLIEQLADAGIRHVRIAGSIQQYAVRRRLRCGREWGMTVRYSDLHGEELLVECLASEGQCLFLLGDHLYDTDFGRLVERAAAGDDMPAASGADRSGLWRIHDHGLIRHSLDDASDALCYENPLTSVQDYHRANLRVVRGLLPRLNVPGARFHRAAIADWESDIASTASIGNNVFVGKHCRIGHLARLDSDCVLANGVIVEDGARLENVTVLPNCFIGRQMGIRDAVMGPDGMISLEGAFWPVENSKFLGATRDSRESYTGLPDRRLAERY